MAVDAVSAISTNNAAADASSSSSASAAAGATINYNDFLQLLIAQMKDQDPTSPMDASAQISQLASFSQVEQQIQTNSHLETVRFMTHYLFRLCSRSHAWLTCTKSRVKIKMSKPSTFHE